MLLLNEDESLIYRIFWFEYLIFLIPVSIDTFKINITKVQIIFKWWNPKYNKGTETNRSLSFRLFGNVIRNFPDCFFLNNDTCTLKIHRNTYSTCIDGRIWFNGSARGGPRSPHSSYSWVVLIMQFPCDA